MSDEAFPFRNGWEGIRSIIECDTENIARLEIGQEFLIVAIEPDEKVKISLFIDDKWYATVFGVDSLLAAKLLIQGKHKVRTTSSCLLHGYFYRRTP